MFNCRVSVYAFVYSSQTHIPYIVSSTKGHYTPLLMDMNTEEPYSFMDCVYTILDSYVSTSIKKIPLFLLDVKKQESLITVYYVCRLPIDSKVVNAYNIPYHQMINDNLVQKALLYV